MKRYLLTFGEMVMVGLFLLAVSGCVPGDGMRQTGAGLLAATGFVSQGQADTLLKTTEKLGGAIQEITPEQEYYIGRTVGATILQTYPLYEDQAATQYVNLLGQSLLKLAGAGETFAGYHFVILDSPEINAFAAPGGFIFTTRGMLRLCANEEMAAAVLAHEIAHVELKHGMQAIKTSRFTSAASLLAMEGANSVGTPQFQELTNIFGESIRDSVTTLVDTGYSRSSELAADRMASRFLETSGYQTAALVFLLESMDKTDRSAGGGGFFKTHPAPIDRVNEIRATTPSLSPLAPSTEFRRQRFLDALKNV